jgi:C4-dicarboxylate-specific signal transduction histidine kinase
MSLIQLHRAFCERLNEKLDSDVLLPGVLEDIKTYLPIREIELNWRSRRYGTASAGSTEHTLSNGASVRMRSEDIEQDIVHAVLAQIEACLRLCAGTPSEEVEQLEQLLSGLQRVSATLDRKLALKHFQGLLQAHVPHRAGVVTDGHEVLLSWGHEPAHLSLLQDVLSTGQTVITGDTIGCPMPENGAVVLWVDGPPEKVQKALEMSAVTLGFVLQNCAHYVEVVEARKLLRDSQAQIVHSSKMAAVGQLAAGVAHELNSPLGAVMLQLDAASLNLERKRYEKAAARLESAETAAATAKEIISKLLFYSRDATKGLRSVDLNEVVDDTLALLGKQLSYDNLELQIQRGDIPTVEANQNELQQVVTNLLLNAKDAVMEPGAQSKTVEVRTFHDQTGVHLEVLDKGPGISDTVKAKIFDPFFTTKPVGRGTGLGLSVSHKIIEQHGGRLSAENREVGGACFRLSLPETNGDSVDG